MDIPAVDNENSENEGGKGTNRYKLIKIQHKEHVTQTEETLHRGGRAAAGFPATKTMHREEAAETNGTAVIIEIR